MKPSFQDSPACTCANRHLLVPGHTCEICMGVVPQPITAEQESQYDVAYFEALEEAYTNQDWAA